jgi:chitodextrinase
MAQNLQPAGITPSSANITWSAPPGGAIEYAVFMNGKLLAYTQSTRFDLTNLMGNTSYTFAVRAVGFIGESPLKAEKVFYTPPNPPGPIYYDDITYHNAKMRWSTPTQGGGADEYRIYRDGVYVATTKDFNYFAQNLAPNTEYTYTVTAVGKGGESPKTVFRTFKTLFPPPYPPTGLHVNNITHNSAMLVWNVAVGEVTGYRIYRGNGSLVGTTNNRTATSYSLSGLSGSTSYSYYVVAVGPGGWSQPSSTVAFKTLAPPPPPVTPPKETPQTPDKPENKTPKSHKDIFLSENEEYLSVLEELMGYALEIEKNNVGKANNLIFQYMRDGKYDGGVWPDATGGIDTKKTKQLREKLNRTGYFNNNTYADGYGNQLDMRHLGASIHAITHETSSIANFFSGLDEKEIDLAATTVGDLASGIGNYYAYTQMNNKDFSFDNFKSLYSTNKNAFPNMPPHDLLEDIDAYLIAQKLKGDSKLTFYNAFVSYYSTGIESAKKDYFNQYTDKKWKSMVKSTITNGNVKKIIKNGATDVLNENNQKLDSKNYNKKITNDFFGVVSNGFKEFLSDFYGGYRK